MPLHELRDRACIVGVGDTPQGSLPDKSGDELGVDAFKAALDDSGLDKSAIDGLFVQKSFGGQGDYLRLGMTLGLNPKVGGTLEGSGATGAHLLMHAAQLLASGMATHIAVVYATNQRTNRNKFQGGGLDDLAVYGLFNPSGMFAMAWRRYMYLYGATEEHLGAIPVHEYKYANMNPKAVQKRELGLEDYLASRYIVWPLHMFDYCYITDGGHCFILTTPDRAAGSAKPPVYIAGMGRQEAFRAFETPDLVMQSFQQKATASMAFEMAGMGPSDIDALYVQDAYSPAIIAALENYGFCKEGEAAFWVQNGRMDIGGDLPINVNGGQLAETYMVGWQNTCDAVRQLRGEAGVRQVPGVERILSTHTGGLREHAAALVYRK